MYITMVFPSRFLPLDKLLWPHTGVPEGCYSTRIRCVSCWCYIRATSSIRLDPVASCRGSDSVGVAGSFVNAAVLLLLLVVLLRTSKLLDAVTALRWLLLQREIHLWMLCCYCSTLLLLAGLVLSLLPDSRELLYAAVAFLPAPWHWNIWLSCSALRILHTLMSEVRHRSLENFLDRIPRFVRSVLTAAFFDAIVVYACVFHWREGNTYDLFFCVRNLRCYRVYCIFYLFDKILK